MKTTLRRVILLLAVFASGVSAADPSGIERLMVGDELIVDPKCEAVADAFSEELSSQLAETRRWNEARFELISTILRKAYPTGLTRRELEQLVSDARSHMRVQRIAEERTLTLNLAVFEFDDQDRLIRVYPIESAPITDATISTSPPAAVAPH